MPITPDIPPDDIAALRAALAAERLARQEAEARAAVGNGARLLVVQGPDAGGHRGTLDPAAEPGRLASPP